MIDWLSTSRETGKAMEAADYAWPHFQKWAESRKDVRLIERRPTAFVVYETEFQGVADNDQNPLINWLFYRKSLTFMGIPLVFMSDNVLK